MEIIVILCLVASIAWLVLKVRAHGRALKKATLDQAWHIVLDDPNYVHRRQFQERKHEEEARLRKEAEGL